MKFAISATLLLVTSALSAALPAPDAVGKRQSIRINPISQVKLSEAFPDTPFGASANGEASQSIKVVSTLVAFQMPSNDYTSRQCNLIFNNPTIATGSKTFRLFDFLPTEGKQTFDARYATFNFRTGNRNNDLKTFKVGETANPVISFPCPAPGKYLNYDIVPANGDSNIQWTTPAGGLWLQVV